MSKAPAQAGGCSPALPRLVIILAVDMNLVQDNDRFLIIPSDLHQQALGSSQRRRLRAPGIIAVNDWIDLARKRN